VSTYREIVGKKIKKVSSDPSSGLDGEMWYNSTSGSLRGLAIVEAWASSSPLSVARSTGTGFGVTTAAVYAGGRTTATVTTTEEYNGTGWSSGGALNTAKYELGGTTAGTQTAGLCYGSQTSPPGFNVSAACEEYDGTSWTNGNNMATNVSFMGGSGIQTAAFSAGGRTPSNTNNSQEYDGTNWSNGNNINTTRQALAGMGTQTAGIIAGGEAPGGGTNSTETYDGTNWTAAPNLGTARYRLSGSGSDSTACLVFGGRFNPPAADKAQTEAFDGTSWTEKADLATARQQLSGNRGTSSSAIAAGGLPPPASATADTEEFTSSTNVITNGAWASGNNINTARTLGGSAIPSVSDGIIFGGGAPYKDATEKYDGTTWTTVPGTLNTARGYISGFGTSTAAVAAGGYTAPNNPQSLVEEYNGSSWSEETNLPGSRKSAGNCGTLTAGLIMGGSTAQPYGANVVNTAFEYNGTSWTATPGNMPEAKGQGMSGGTQTAAYYCGGRTPPNSYTTKTAEYDGSSFSEGGDIISIGGPPSGGQGATGTQTAGLATGGTPTTTNTYNGTSWITAANFNTGRNRGFSGGTATAALLAGGGEPGGSPGYGNETEEFTGATETANIETFTTS
jgi:hypothetical protein